MPHKLHLNNEENLTALLLQSPNGQQEGVDGGSGLREAQIPRTWPLQQGLLARVSRGDKANDAQMWVFRAFQGRVAAIWSPPSSPFFSAEEKVQSCGLAALLPWASTCRSNFSRGIWNVCLRLVPAPQLWSVEGQPTCSRPAGVRMRAWEN
jgi:hypothetical protein